MSIDNYIGAEVMMERGDTKMTGQVQERKREHNGTFKGTSNPNPLLDTRSYIVEFPDGMEKEYGANIIAQNMYAQCDADGNQFVLLEDIVDYKKDGRAVKEVDAFININGKSHRRKTTDGWFLCVQWKDGSTTWEKLSKLKESNPIEVAEYAVAQDISHEPAFAWWVPHTLRKRERIIMAVNSRYHKTTHKFGICIPKTVREALELDKSNGNSLWKDAIEKEMRNVGIAFKILDNNDNVPIGYQFMKCHLIFTVKMDSFERKARLVAGGHMIDTPSTITYASVVSRESVRIALTMAAFHDLEVQAGDIQNAYLTAPCNEKVYTTCGPEFGANEGKKAIIVRALYGLASAGASFRNHLADCMRSLGYTSCVADPDVWMKAAVRPDDGFEYYAYVLLYVDDTLCISHDAKVALEEINQHFTMKKKSMGKPDIYLGAKLHEVRMPNGVTAWAMSSSKYVQESISNVRKYIHDKEYKIPKSATSPFPREYRPEIDVSEELSQDDASFYQSQIGVLRWIVELGRVDIIVETSMLASHVTLPRIGHLEAMLHIFGYLHNRHNARIAFDPTIPDINQDEFVRRD